jgi:RNA polymerase sigma-70 factor, ECF subfamily
MPDPVNAKTDRAPRSLAINSSIVVGFRRGVERIYCSSRAVKERWSGNKANPTEVIEDVGALMNRIKRRDPQAFETLYDAHSKLVYGVAYRMLADRPAAEDLTQTVFLKLWNAPEHFRGGNLAAWLARVTRNRALDVLRSRSARAEGELPEALPEEETLEDIAFARIDAERVRAALAGLPPEQREPIELGFFGGITHEEIARRVRAPLGTVKTRIRSGLRKLRSALGEAVTV